MAVTALPGRHGPPRLIVSATASHPWAAAAPVLDAVDVGRVELLLGDFARALCCEVALLCQRGRNGQPQIVSVWGMDGAAGLAAQGPGGARHRGGREGGFVGRALTDERATIEALDRDRDTGLIHAARGMPLTQAAAAPMRVLGGVRATDRGLLGTPARRGDRTMDHRVLRQPDSPLPAAPRRARAPQHAPRRAHRMPNLRGHAPRADP